MDSSWNLDLRPCLNEPLSSSADEASLWTEDFRLSTGRSRERGGLALKRMVILVLDGLSVPDVFSAPGSGFYTSLEFMGTLFQVLTSLASLTSFGLSLSVISE